MKKVFTLALALLVVVAGYSQVIKVSSKSDMKAAQEIVVTGDESYEFVGNLPSITRGEQELEYSTYDWQTNTAARNLTMNFPDGKVGFAYTIATTADYADRGTDIVIYDPADDSWTTVGGKIENKKTGFGCAARYGENGIVVVSRDAVSLNCGVYIIEDKDNLPAPGTVAPIIEWEKDDRNIHFPAVMCTGPDHRHIHILFTALNWTDENGLTNPFFYFRSMDGGQTWDEFMTIDYLGRDYASAYGSGQDAYFMENTGGNELNIVVNTRRGDGVVLTSTDEGNTWTRTEYYHHPGIDVDFGDPSSDGTWFMYPRWTSALKDGNGMIHLAYEFGGGSGDATSTSYYPLLGGIVYWNEEMPYHGEAAPEYGCDPNNPRPMVPGQPFIADTAYIIKDIYSSWWLWSDATHTMWPEYIGYCTPLGEDEQPLPDPYEATEFIDWNSLTIDSHGHYNGGICEMPVLLTTPANDLLVAVWIGMDEHNMGGVNNDKYFMKLFTRASFDGGNTWTNMQQLTTDFMYQYAECVYPQAAITNNTLVLAFQNDGQPDTFTIGSGGDDDQFDNFYQGMTFDLEELFGYDGIEDVTTESNTAMSIYPNPVSDVMSISLNKDEDVVVYNLMGQSVASFQGHAGVNTFEVSNLNDGIYFISAGNDTQKFIVK